MLWQNWRKKTFWFVELFFFCSLIWVLCVDIGITRILHRSEWQIVPAYFEVKMHIRYAKCVQVGRSALMADGVSWWCFSGPWQCNLLGRQWEPVFIQNILNCVLKTNKAFTGLERHGVSEKLTKFHFAVEYPFKFPFELSRDITENFSLMGTPSLQPFLKTYWLTPVQMTGQLSQSMQIRTREAV